MKMESPLTGGESRWLHVTTTPVPVRNVQDLVASSKELTAATMERYIRPDIDRDLVLPEHSAEIIPVIDLAKLLNPHSEALELDKLRFACEDWGFFQVINHGLPNKVIAATKHDIEDFFQLPLDVKNDHAQRPGEIQGYGQAFVVSNDQKLDWADMLGLFAQPPQARDMSYWPKQPHTFRNSIEEYSSELLQFSHYIETFIAKTLNVDHELMRGNCEVQTLRMTYYPPCMSMSNKVLGFSPHSDGSFITILLEVNSVQGLQIRRHDVWVPVKPHPKALLVNVGDLLEIMTNGKYKSVEHRVTINAHKERLSISAFHVPKFEAIVSPIPDIVEGKVLYKTVRVEEYAKLYLSNELDGKKALDFAKISPT
ncbi:S-norcoclaurine synthase 1 isoform X1 [Brachypodium distachyon]|uniref:Fe2OG dioxygenase domain-containing protein n=1 Tax=Brachypodium distachyon TaxID=15368 RepID=A0A0Q3JJC4_BRADI|nr:S-norcoclaurine synthase 1 isoform X1 [Brachypodium distachyon]XP_024313425.1 S-norcoclaurine synthase 1 isoform X1 [Brachypodium distachyon]KQK17723.2 hypothetical protein BRADI_1g36300v3 [Brachypodium distachyon]|eukprot:XP_024313424.1 S-norcoclaurine synthase 1 isoform X1 [Brachypodium distachyon]